MARYTLETMCAARSTSRTMREIWVRYVCDEYVYARFGKKDVDLRGSLTLMPQSDWDEVRGRIDEAGGPQSDWEEVFGKIDVNR